MKKSVLVLAIVLFIAPLISASCELSVQLLNQDPYPAVPGEYVKVVFQMIGTEESDCGNVYMEVVPAFPFSIEQDSTKMTASSGTYLTGYESFILKGYKLAVDKSALDGANKLKLNYGSNTLAVLTKDFNIEVENPMTDFDVSIQDYDAAKNTITFGIVNIGEKDVEALTLEVPNQENIFVRGSNKIIIGSLSSNDDTTANLEVIPKEGDITVNLEYNDQTNTRRTVEKKVYFSSGYLENLKNAPQPKGSYYYLFWVLIILLLVYFGYGFYTKRKRQANSKKLLLLRNR